MGVIDIEKQAVAILQLAQLFELGATSHGVDAVAYVGDHGVFFTMRLERLDVIVRNRFDLRFTGERSLMIGERCMGQAIKNHNGLGAACQVTGGDQGKCTHIGCQHRAEDNHVRIEQLRQGHFEFADDREIEPRSRARPMQGAIFHQRFDCAIDNLGMIVEPQIGATHEINDTALTFMRQNDGPAG
ncbi:hypothetical protein D3C72_1482810 [compost metagenome]